MDKILHKKPFLVEAIELSLYNSGYIGRDYILVGHQLLTENSKDVATLVYAIGKTGLDYIRMYMVDDYLHVNRMLLDTDVLKASLNEKELVDNGKLKRMNYFLDQLLKKREVLFHDLLMGSNRNNHKMIHDHYDKCEVLTADDIQPNFSLGRLEI